MVTVNRQSDGLLKQFGPIEQGPKHDLPEIKTLLSQYPEAVNCMEKCHLVVKSQWRSNLERATFLQEGLDAPIIVVRIRRITIYPSCKVSRHMAGMTLVETLTLFPVESENRRFSRFREN